MIKVEGCNGLSIKEETIYTVFPKEGSPRDFETYNEALEFAKEFYPDGDYEILSPTN